ncbi:NAD(P)H-dependent oxidoreductase [Telmatocola sphagniphila]|uniref:NAD(P)H-dependent oxidoreductase n=1 Tax=Telmatocola sphagniphila TaxID=1123043 RepID=A0A8E6B1C4_9BACT|nr:NAD(P)H-dependent oxidoreductase [Telmatocola sphagniphila]QVL30165.1 NAD(P)H-dependent oxidoreductase [Telmatocola sphagniphila]
MSVLANEDLLKQLRWRYAVKKFDTSRKISETDWKTLEESLVLAPSSYGLQPWKFIVVLDPAVRAKLVTESWGQTQVADASHLVVFAVKKELTEEFVDKYIQRIAEVRGGAINEGLKKMILGSVSRMSLADVLNWNARQTYIALGTLMTAAAVLGIDSCPMEGIIPEKYDEILGLDKQGFTTLVVCPVGYRANDDKSAVAPKVRFKTEDVIQYI